MSLRKSRNYNEILRKIFLFYIVVGIRTRRDKKGKGIVGRDVSIGVELELHPGRTGQKVYAIQTDMGIRYILSKDIKILKCIYHNMT